MTTQDPQNPAGTDQVAVTGGEVNPADANAQLREAYEREKARRLELQGEVLKGHLSAIGLSHKEGLGKAIAKEYEGDFTLEALAEYAQEEYGYESSGAGVNETKAKEIEQAQTAADQANASSVSVEPPTDMAQINELEDKLLDPESTPQDAAASVAAKLGRLVNQTQ